jgi:bifunctional non-homologous end joining protein LigD
VNRSRASHLEPYRRKRDPERTPEPFGGAPAPPLLPGPRFVVQKHWARALHYDLRLELDGVLKSWAVPKGPSTKAEERRLAVHVEDHPLEYADFEGVIPEGNYGAGSVIVWDRGWFGSFKPEPLLEQYERGKMELELFGSKLRGYWTLVRMGGKGRKGDKGNEWLLLKKADGAASEREAIDRYPESVITGLTVEQIRDVPGYNAALRDQVVATSAPRRAFDPRRAPFTLATSVERPFSGEDWLFEIKYDGVRVLAARRADEVLLLGRSGEEITGRYPEIAAAARALPATDFVLDGEIIATDEHGQPSFQRLQARMLLTKPRDIAAAAARVPVRAVFFDALALAGHDLRPLSLARRKELLRRVVPPLGTIQASDHVLEHGEAFFEAASEMRLEGVMAKRLASLYSGNRTQDWVKIKCQRRQEFVIGGYTEPHGARGWFGALHIGIFEHGRLVYVTKVGGGFDEATLRELHERLQPMRRERSPFAVRSPAGAGHTWVEPRLVCEARFTEWTRDGGLRHPVFLGLREDRRPEECRREEPVALDALAPTIAAAPEAEAREASGDRTPRRPEVKLTNLKKVFWPAEGYTKGDLIAYYEAVAPLLLPYLRDRPLVLTRYPDGIEGKSFFQKDAPRYAHEFVRTETVYASDAEREIDYFVVDDAAALRYVANLGTIPLHVWSARIGSLERPDWLVLDLDPKSAPFAQVVEVARTLHRLLEELGLESFVKTSGASGLHILLPLGGRYTHEETRTFARLLATLGVEALPGIATVVRAIQSREGKVYIDFGQNGHGNTIVAPYSVRPLPGAPASCPLRWDEVNVKLDPGRHTIRTIPERFAAGADPLAPILEGGIDMAAAIARIERRMTGRGERKG